MFDKGSLFWLGALVAGYVVIYLIGYFFKSPDDHIHLGLWK